MKIRSFNILEEEVKRELTTMGPFLWSLPIPVIRGSWVPPSSPSHPFPSLPPLPPSPFPSTPISPAGSFVCGPRNPPPYLLSSSHSPLLSQRHWKLIITLRPCPGVPQCLISNRKEQIKWMEYKHDLCLNTYNGTDFLCAIVSKASYLL